MASFNALAHIAHDMHAQDLHRPQLHIARQVVKVRQILHMLRLLLRSPPLQQHTYTYTFDAVFSVSAEGWGKGERGTSGRGAAESKS